MILCVYVFCVLKVYAYEYHRSDSLGDITFDMCRLKPLSTVLFVTLYCIFMSRKSLSVKVWSTVVKYDLFVLMYHINRSYFVFFRIMKEHSAISLRVTNLVYFNWLQWHIPMFSTRCVIFMDLIDQEMNFCLHTFR